MKQITAAMFVACTGRKPELDDLDRVNCKFAGEVGHYHCGWNWVLSAPVFAVGRVDREEPWRYRDCMDCGHSWAEKVRYGSPVTISGEWKASCPMCRSKSIVSGPIFMRENEDA